MLKGKNGKSKAHLPMTSSSQPFTKKQLRMDMSHKLASKKALSLAMAKKKKAVEGTSSGDNIMISPTALL